MVGALTCPPDAAGRAFGGVLQLMLETPYPHLLWGDSVDAMGLGAQDAVAKDPEGWGLVAASLRRTVPSASDPLQLVRMLLALAAVDNLLEKLTNAPVPAGQDPPAG